MRSNTPLCSLNVVHVPTESKHALCRWRAVQVTFGKLSTVRGADHAETTRATEQTHRADATPATAVAERDAETVRVTDRQPPQPLCPTGVRQQAGLRVPTTLPGQRSRSGTWSGTSSMWRWT